MNAAAGEECDDGNAVEGDGCDNACEIEWSSNTVECTLIGGSPFECEDGVDNDMDGLIDLDDPDCISPCDDSEAFFQRYLPDGNLDCWQDCYWDLDSGAGNDDCEWNYLCDPKNPSANMQCDIGCGVVGGVSVDPVNCSVSSTCDAPNTPQSQVCLDVCEPLAPNGCDCFGCCLLEVPDGMGGQVTTSVHLGATQIYTECGSETLDKCTRCTLQTGCYNPCDEAGCEVCIGQTAPSDPSCAQPACNSGTQVACSHSADCVPDATNGLDPATSYYCLTGCCIPVDPYQ